MWEKAKESLEKSVKVVNRQKTACIFSYRSPTPPLGEFVSPGTRVPNASFRHALAFSPARVRLEPLAYQTSMQNDIQVLTLLEFQNTGLVSAEYDLTVVSLANKVSLTTSLPEQDNNPSLLVNNYLGSVPPQHPSPSQR
jgi:hypothetical protein